MANLGLQNNNPGNLRDPSTGQFRVFQSPQEGQQALIQDLTAKQTGQSSHIKPGASINDLGKVWAPDSDNNTGDNWAVNVAKYLGVPTAYAFDKVPTDKLAKAVQVAEGTSSMNMNQSNTQQGMSISDFGKMIQQKYPQYAGKDATVVGQAVLKKYPQYQSKVNMSDSNTQQTGNVQQSQNAQQSPQQVVPQAQNTPQQANQNAVSQMTEGGASSLPGEKGLANFAIGGGRGLIQGADIGSNIGSWIANNTAGRLVNAVQGKGWGPTSTGSSGTMQGAIGQSNLSSLENAQGTAQSIGKVVLPAAIMSGAGILGSAGEATAGASEATGETGAAFAKPEAQQVLQDYADKVGVDVGDLGPSETSDALSKASDATDNDYLKQVYDEAHTDFLNSMSSASNEAQQVVTQAVKSGVSLKGLLEWATGLGTAGVLGDEAWNAGKKMIQGVASQAAQSANPNTQTPTSSFQPATYSANP